MLKKNLDIFFFFAHALKFSVSIIVRSPQGEFTIDSSKLVQYNFSRNMKYAFINLINYTQQIDETVHF